MAKTAATVPLAIFALLGGCSSTTRTLVKAHVTLPPPALPLLPPRASDGLAVWGKAAFAPQGSFEDSKPLDGASGEPLKAEVPSLLFGLGAGSTIRHDLYAAIEADISGADIEAGWILHPKQTTLLLYAGLGLHAMSMDLLLQDRKSSLLGIYSSTTTSPYSYDGFGTTKRLGLTATFRDTSFLRPFLAIALQLNPTVAPNDVSSGNTDASRSITYFTADLGTQIRFRRRGSLQFGIGSVSATGGLGAHWWRASGAFSWEWERP